MSLTFSWRSTTITAYYAPGGEISGSYDQGNATLASIQPNAVTGNIGDSALDLNNAGLNGWRSWTGLGNTPLTATISLVYRLANAAAGTATSNNSLFQLGADTGSYFAILGLQQQGGTGDFKLYMRSEAGATAVNNLTMVSGFNWPDTSYHDLVLTWGGTTTSLVQLFLDGVTIGSAATIRNVNHDNGEYPWNNIVAGRYLTNNTSTHTVNEFLIFDTELSQASIAAAFPGTSRSAFYSTAIETPINSTDPGEANVVGTNYTFKGTSITGSYSTPTYSDPGISQVASGTDYIFNDATLTGTLSIPQATTSTASTVPISTIKEQIRYVLAANNTATGAPTQDLSENMKKRVQGVFKVNPEVIPLNNNVIPAVTVFTESKSPITQTGVMRDGLTGKRKAELNLSVVGMVYAPNWVADKTNDIADDEIEFLMENVERVLRAYDNLGGNVNWHFPNNVTYHSISWDEETHFRAGIMDLKVTLLY